MGFDKNNRTSLRIGIKRLTSIIEIGGQFELVTGDKKPVQTIVKVMDMSTGGLCIHSNIAIKAGVVFDLAFVKSEDLDASTVRSECLRSNFHEDPLYNKSYYEIGLKFEKPNTDYLKKLYELALAKKL